MSAMSRVEGILDGTYTGRPLSRVEQLLMNGGAGGGGTDVSGIIQDISDIQTEMSHIHNFILQVRDEVNDVDIKTDQLGGKVDVLEITVDSEKTKTAELVTHALTDAPLALSK